jgi:thiol-disulfide isomerase/thioredoxin
MYSATIPLNTKDSIINPLMFSKNFSRKIYGKSALLSIGQNKFIIGIFDCNSNDSLDALDVVSISELKNNNSILYKCADKVNSNYAKKLKYILIENQAYQILVVDLTKINIERINTSDDIKEYNFINCLTTIKQFDSKFIDSTGEKVNSSRLYFANGKPTIIYFTAAHCAPCEKLKPFITELQYSSKINLIIVSTNSDNSRSDFADHKNRFYFEGYQDQSKIWNSGYPEILIFDIKGQFIESDNTLQRENLIKKYVVPQ